LLLNITLATLVIPLRIQNQSLEEVKACHGIEFSETFQDYQETQSHGTDINGPNQALRGHLTTGRELRDGEISHLSIFISFFEGKDLGERSSC
jgi:hypothetical protein